MGLGCQKYITIPTIKANIRLCTNATILLEPLAGILINILGVIKKNKITIKKNLKIHIIIQMLSIYNLIIIFIEIMIIIFIIFYHF